MGQDKLSKVLHESLQQLDQKGIHKGSEKVITAIHGATDGLGPRYSLAGYGRRKFLRMNSNSYLGLSLHTKIIKAEEEAVRAFGTGPGAVRFISGTLAPHVQLEKQLAQFHGRPEAMIFSAAYAAIMGVIPQLINEETIVLSDALNHNSIINSIRLARPAQKIVYQHLDMADLEKKIQSCQGQARRLLVISDGVFSMRGDSVPLAEVTALCRKYQGVFAEGITTIIDDSHGVGAFGRSGRGVEEYSNARADILVATLGKALGVNGGYVVATTPVINYLRQTSPFYIYSNPITPPEAAAAAAALSLLDSGEGRELLATMRHMGKRFRAGLLDAGYEVLSGDHPIIPLMLRDTVKTKALVRHLFEHNVLVTGLNYPVVPQGDEEIRFQVSASHTERDIDYVLQILAQFTA
ncbi:MAG: aminotransferase class I/II-fold pyridoxal phosphate-dependent enzyme [Desulfobulbaceae bacterium]|uniref:Aminotransferase class I/II-fold pyridoxal phosphate-dependent enzyme n=1 Tax=Candidatus Desulfatifera sulfidica TaxID=2841691 RepID=A0A8J6N843_9BACT|nr:aminotransferase class I/II-fold pyridoxal phosphate-dependent enzyme [Candidatus Desulfatifera sulfidica]